MKLAVKRLSEQLQPANFRFLFPAGSSLLVALHWPANNFLIQLANSNQWLTSGYFDFQPISPAARHFRIYFSSHRIIFLFFEFQFQQLVLIYMRRPFD